ncbi:MAG: cupin domain-containing protein [Lentisphaeria bacterium]|nr:cupin domain-containing protein [Lentisphaeria bacterium]
MKKTALLSAVLLSPGEERIEELLRRPGLRVERIVSMQATSPPDFWYDQDWDEWVAVLAGCGTLLFADGPERVTLQVGEAMLIPAHCRHRVESTDPDNATIWLAIHFPPTEDK